MTSSLELLKFLPDEVYTGKCTRKSGRHGRAKNYLQNFVEHPDYYPGFAEIEPVEKWFADGALKFENLGKKSREVLKAAVANWIKARPVRGGALSGPTPWFEFAD